MHPGAGTTLSTGDGRRRVRLGKLIKSGGAGSVYRLADDTASVAKIYHADQDLALYERKVTAMLALTPQLPELNDRGTQYVQIAWPQTLLRNDRGRFVGWLMPAVHVDQTSELECILQERQAIQHGLPTGLGAKVTLAANLAAVIAELHRQQHHVVDMKPVNLRFYPKSLYMAMLDCDGFSIHGRSERFVATQVTPDYLAPEFQRGGLTAAGEETQDRFALATIVFQLLNFGLHPYSGRPANDRVATDIPGRIAQRAYAYGRRANPQIAPNPVSGHLAIAADLRLLFDRAFESSGTGRPAAAEWAGALRAHAQRAQGRLVICTRDPVHQHFAGLPCAACARAALIAGTAQRAGEAERAMAARVAKALPPSLPIAGRRRTSPPPPPPATRPATRPSARPARRPWQPPTGATRPPPRPLPSYPPFPPPPRPQSGWVTLWRVLTFRFGWGRKTSLLEFLLVGLAFIALQVFGYIGRHTSDPFSPSAGNSTQERIERVRAERDARRQADAERNAEAAAARDAERRARRLALFREEIDGAILDVLAGEAVYITPPPGSRPRVGAADDLRSLQKLMDDARIQCSDPNSCAADEAVREESLVSLRVRAAAAPDDPHLSADLGWLLLLTGAPADAREAFVRSISAAPDRPSAWHGLALAATNDGDRVGARAIAEIHAAGHANAGPVRERVLAAERALGLDPVRWQLIDARARVLAARRMRLPVSDPLRELAKQPLPP